MSEGSSSVAAELHPGDILQARVFRFDPSRDREPFYEVYEVPYAPAMRILDVLEYINEELGADIAYQWYCSVKKCGTCAMLVNGTPKLTCWEPAERRMTIEPLRNLPVVRDLVTGRGPYEAVLQDLEPELKRGEPYPGFPEAITDLDMAGVNDLIGCIECLCCYSACPVVALGDTTFAGPAPLVQLGRFVLDPRDKRDLSALNLTDGQVFQCVSCYACEASCPAHIPIVSGAIEKLKTKLHHEGGRDPGVRHGEVFIDLVRSRGKIDASMLVMRSRGLSKAALSGMGTGIRMMLHGKTKPLRSLLGKAMPGAAEIKKLMDVVEQRRSWKEEP